MTSKRWILAAVSLGSGIVFLDSTIVYVALRAIGEQLPADLVGVLEGQSYIVNGYLLTLSALLILAGALADRYGRRRLFIIGLAGFGAASLACGLAPTMEILILGRLVQGGFGALLVPTSLALINANFEGADRGQAFGIWASITGALTILGPPVGGFLVDSLGWQVAFLINVPLVALGVWVAATQVPESTNPDAPSRFDWLGAAAIAIAVGGLAYGAIRGQEQQWQDPTAWAALIIGAVATVALVPLMTRRREPLVPPSLFGSRNFTVTNISTLLIYGALYVYSNYQALFLQGALGYTALASGLAGLPISAAIALLSTWFGRQAGEHGPRRFMAAGPAFMALSLLWLVRIPADSEPWAANMSHVSSLIPPGDYFVDVLPSVLLFAIGIAMLVAPLTTALMTSVPVGNSGLASAINNAVSRVGPILAGAVIFIAVTAAFYGGLQDRQPQLDGGSAQVREQFAPMQAPPRDVPQAQQDAAREASTDGFHLAMLISGLLCAAGAAVNWVGIRDPSREELARAETASAASG